jgi:hypothetical protein
VTATVVGTLVGPEDSSVSGDRHDGGRHQDIHHERDRQQERVAMKFSIGKHGIAVLGFIVATAPALALAAEPDWKAVEQALGKAGQLQPGDVFRIGMPRSDLAVTVNSQKP